MAALAQRAAHVWRWFSEAADNRPHAQLSSSLIAMLAATGVAVAALVETRFGGIFCHVDARLAGANIQRALDVVIVAGLVGVGAAILMRNQPRLRVLNLLFVAAALVSGIVLVAVDSGVSKEITTCSFFGTSTSTKTHNVFYLYFIWIPALLTIGVQAVRDRRAVGDWRPGLALLGIVPAALVAGLVQAVHASTAGKAEQRAGKKAGPPDGVLVCRDPIQGPEALGGWQCPSNTDIGRAPVESPQSLMCVGDLRDVKNATVRIQIVYDGRLVSTRHLHSSDSSTEAYVVLDRSFYPTLATSSGLRAGRYRCRFLARGRLVHDRAFIVKRVPATQPARLVLPHAVQRISFIPHSLFDPGSADKIARRSRYSAWVNLGNDHTADVAVWPSRPAAVRAVRMYRRRGPETRPLDAPPWPGRVVRVDLFENVTVAWYTRPTRGDRAAFKRALLVPHGGDQYTDSG